MKIIKPLNTPINNWNSSKTYGLSELVTYSGNTYASLLDGNKNNNPLSSSGKWKLSFNTNDINLVLNIETDFLSNLGSEENLQQFEGEVLDEILNPIENYDVIRFIHKPYSISTGTTLTQSDIWFYFYFLIQNWDSGKTYEKNELIKYNGNKYISLDILNKNNNPLTSPTKWELYYGLEYVQDYRPQDISSRENELMLKQSTDSFFRLEFYKTPHILNEYEEIIGYEPPTRVNRKLVFSRNLSLPLGEKMFYNTLSGYVNLPVFNGNNYRNKENMYLFWFEQEDVFIETNLSGTTSGNTFFMTAKFYNAKNGNIVDFTNSGFTQNYEVTEESDMYYQVDIDRTNHTYEISNYNGITKGTRVGTVSGTTINAVKFYEKR